MQISVATAFLVLRPNARAFMELVAGTIERPVADFETAPLRPDRSAMGPAPSIRAAHVALGRLLGIPADASSATLEQALRGMDRASEVARLLVESRSLPMEPEDLAELLRVRARGLGGESFEAWATTVEALVQGAETRAVPKPTPPAPPAPTHSPSPPTATPNAGSPRVAAATPRPSSGASRRPGLGWAILLLVGLGAGAFGVGRSCRPEPTEPPRAAAPTPRLPAPPPPPAAPDKAVPVVPLVAEPTRRRRRSVVHPADERPEASTSEPAPEEAAPSPATAPEPLEPAPVRTSVTLGPLSVPPPPPAPAP